jgi:hypothetical protein
VAHTTNLTPERHIEVPVPRQYSKQSCICCYSLIHFFSVSTFFLVDFNTNLTVWHFLSLFSLLWLNQILEYFEETSKTDWFL